MARVGRLTRGLGVLAIVLATVGCDRVTKQAASRYLANRPILSLAGDSLRLEYVENRGGFLSLGADLPTPLRTATFTIGTSIMLVWLGLWVGRRALAGGWIMGPALLWAGGVANLADRIVFGRVVDFMNRGLGGLRTGIFNVADVAITLGAFLVIFELTRGRMAQQSPSRRTRG